SPRGAAPTTDGRSILAPPGRLQRQQTHIGFGQQSQALALVQALPALDFLAATATAEADVLFEFTDLDARALAHGRSWAEKDRMGARIKAEHTTARLKYSIARLHALNATADRHPGRPDRLRPLHPTRLSRPHRPGAGHRN